MQQGSSPALLSSRVILQGKVRIFTANKRVILVFIVFRGGELLEGRCLWPIGYTGINLTSSFLPSSWVWPPVIYNWGRSHNLSRRRGFSFYLKNTERMEDGLLGFLDQWEKELGYKTATLLSVVGQTPHNSLAVLTEERLETDQVRLCKWIFKFSPSCFLALKCMQIALKLRDNIRFQAKLQDFQLKAKQTHKDYSPPAPDEKA